MPRLVPLAAALLTLVLDGPGPCPAAAPDGPQDVVSAVETALADAIARAQPSVVSILRIKGETDEMTAVRGRSDPGGPRAPADDPLQARFGAERLRPAPQRESRFDYALPGDFASGVVIGEKGEIVTTYHTLKGAAQIWVAAPGRPEFEAEILAADPRSDLAVIAPKAPVEPKLPPLPLGDAARLRPGAMLLALGNSYNAARDGRASASWGILANVARKVVVPNPEDNKAVVRDKQLFRHQATLLQLDAKLNLGLSGGAVVNLKGELVGITTAAASPTGYDLQAGYAIPIDPLGRRAVETLRQGKEVEYGFIGVHISGDNPNKIQDVTPGTPAARASLLANDVVLAVGDRELTETDELSLALASVPVGEPVVLTVRGVDAKVRKATVRMSKYPIAGQVIATNRPGAWRGLRVDYTSVLTNNGGLPGDSVLEAMGKGGVGVLDVEPRSPAESAGLRRGQVITAVDDQPVATPTEFARAVSGRKGPITLTTELGTESGKKVTVR